MGEDISLGSCHHAQWIILAVNIASVVIGFQYGDPDQYGGPYICNITIVPRFLKISGGTMIGFADLSVFCTMCLKYNKAACSDDTEVADTEANTEEVAADGELSNTDAATFGCCGLVG